MACATVDKIGSSSPPAATARSASRYAVCSRESCRGRSPPVVPGAGCTGVGEGLPLFSRRIAVRASAAMRQSSSKPKIVTDGTCPSKGLLRIIARTAPILPAISSPKSPTRRSLGTGIWRNSKSAVGGTWLIRSERGPREPDPLYDDGHTTRSEGTFAATGKY